MYDVQNRFLSMLQICLVSSLTIMCIIFSVCLVVSAAQALNVYCCSVIAGNYLMNWAITVVLQRCVLTHPFISGIWIEPYVRIIHCLFLAISVKRLMFRRVIKDYFLKMLKISQPPNVSKCHCHLTFVFLSVSTSCN